MRLITEMQSSCSRLWSYSSTTSQLSLLLNSYPIPISHSDLAHSNLAGEHRAPHHRDGELLLALQALL